MVARYPVFFDIDGTLLLTDGAGREALRAALEAVYGTSGPLEGYRFHGKTDPQIVVELIGGAGWEEDEIRRRMPSVWPVYLARLESELAARRCEGRIQILPGVPELLAVLRDRPDIALGLLTGNIEEGARLKLEAADLMRDFQFGGFGSDSEERAEVARIAVERSRTSLGEAIEPGAMVVLGDTPEDIACARAVQAHAVGVATGWHAVDVLERSGADAVFSDFSNTGKVLDCILSLSGAGGTSAGAAVGNGGGR